MTATKTKVITSSIFNMDNVREIFLMDHTAGKAYAIGLVGSAENINVKTRFNVTNMINRSKSREALGTAMSNWMLAHPSEGLKTI